MKEMYFSHEKKNSRNQKTYLCDQTKKISQSLFQQIVAGVCSKALTSKYWMAISVYECDIWRPCAVLSLCKKCLLLKIELLHSKHNLRVSIMQAVGRNWFCLASRTLLTASNPDIISILVNIMIISKFTNLQRDVNVLLLFKLSIIVSISDVSFTLLSIFKTSEYKHFQAKIDKYPIAVPRLLVITLTGLLYVP